MIRKFASFALLVVVGLSLAACGETAVQLSPKTPIGSIVQFKDGSVLTVTAPRRSDAVSLYGVRYNRTVDIPVDENFEKFLANVKEVVTVDNPQKYSALMAQFQTGL